MKLSKNQITKIEAIYLAIDEGRLSTSLCNLLIDSVNQKNNEEYVYLMWLLNRWRYKRLHKTHLPKRINSLCS